MSLLVEMMENKATKLSDKAKLWNPFASNSKNHRQEEVEEGVIEGEEIAGRRRKFKRAGKAVVLVQKETTTTISDATLSLIMDRFSPC